MVFANSRYTYMYVNIYMTIYIYIFIYTHAYPFGMNFECVLSDRWTNAAEQLNKKIKGPTRKKIWFPDFEGARPCHAQLWSVTINGGFSTKEGVLAEQAWPTRIHVKLTEGLRKFSTCTKSSEKITKCCISVFVSFLSDHLILGIYEFETRCNNWKGNLSW